MNSYKSKNKNADKKISVARRSSAMNPAKLTERTARKPSRGLHDSLLPGSGVIQRYTERDGNKTSQNGLLYTTKDGQLYADADKIREAADRLSAVRTCPITFGAGPELGGSSLSSLKKTVVLAKLEEEWVSDPETILLGAEAVAQKTAFGRLAELLGSLGDEGNFLALITMLEDDRFDSEKSGKDKVETSILEMIKDIGDVLSDEGMFSFNIKDIYETFGKAELFKAITQFSDYLLQCSTSKETVMLPTDCGQFAGMITGIPGLDTAAPSKVKEASAPVPGALQYVDGGRDPLQEIEHHWGAIVMEDGEDHVTLENAVSTRNRFFKPILDNQWTFEMYGPGEGQTFPDRHAHYFDSREDLFHKVYQSKTAQLMRSDSQPPSLSAASSHSDRVTLPPSLKAGMESLSGLDLSDVEVHYHSPRPAAFNALAYTQGSNIYLAPGTERFLPHEAWHVVQQKLGKVAPTFQLHGMGINDSAYLEAEADRMGERAASSPAAASQKLRLSDPPSSPIQRVYAFDGKVVKYFEKPDQYYEKQGFHPVKENGYLAWAPPGKEEETLQWMRIQKYTELPEDPNEDSLNAQDAAGVIAMAQQIMERFPPSDYHYVFPGASGDAVAAVLRNLGVKIHRVALSGLESISKSTIPQLALYIKNSLPKEIFTDGKPVLLADAFSSGASLAIFQILMKTVRPDLRIVPLALNNLLEPGVKGASFGEKSKMETASQNGLALISRQTKAGDNPNIVYAEQRIFRQKYKELLPRPMPKFTVQEALEHVEAPPKPNMELEQRLILEGRAMLEAAKQEPTVLKDSDRELRRILTHCSLPLKDIQKYLEDSALREQVKEQILEPFIPLHLEEIIVRVFHNREDPTAVLNSLSDSVAMDILNLRISERKGDLKTALEEIKTPLLVAIRASGLPEEEKCGAEDIFLNNLTAVESCLKSGKTSVEDLLRAIRNSIDEEKVFEDSDEDQDIESSFM